VIANLDAASIILIIGAFGTMLVTVIGSIASAVMAYQAKTQAVVTTTALTENTKLTTQAVEVNGEIKALVNGTQSSLLQKLSDTQAALNSTYAEIRSLRAINAAQQAHLAVASQPAANGEQDKREAQQDRRDERQDQRDLRQVERTHNAILVGSESAARNVLAEIETSTKQTAEATGKTADTLKEMQAETKPK
jgi:5-deoxy-D-glucuronate isomerase